MPHPHSVLLVQPWFMVFGSVTTIGGMVFLPAGHLNGFRPIPAYEAQFDFAGYDSYLCFARF